MLDLSILCNRMAAVSPLPLRICSAGSRPADGLWELCPQSLICAAGQAAYTITDDFLFFALIRQKNTDRALLIGPATEYPVTAQARQRIAARLSVRGKAAQSLNSRLSQLPVIMLTDFLQQLSLLNYIINEEDTLFYAGQADPPQPLSAQPPQRQTPGHNTAQLETQLLSCVEAGDTEQLQQLLQSSRLQQSTTGVRYRDSLKAQKTLVVSSCALVARAAIRGGMDYDTALSLNDAYLLRLEKLRTVASVQQLMWQMMMDFTTRTAQLRLPAQCSPMIRRAVGHISRNLYGKLTVQSIAQALQVSRSYLSHQFIREMGQPLTDYIARQKIEEAIRLMQTNGPELAQIAYQLGFSSQSYFHKVFKKITGQSPGQYLRTGEIPIK